MPQDFTPIQLCPVHRQPAGEDGRCQLCIDEDRRAGGGSAFTMVAASLFFLVACGAGGYLMFNLLSPRAAPAVPVAAPVTPEENTQKKAKEKAEKKTEISDGGVTRYSLPSGELVVRRGPPMHINVRLPRVEKKHGGEIRRERGGRITVKLHGKPGRVRKPRAAKDPAAEKAERAKREEARLRRERLEQEVQARGKPQPQPQQQPRARVLMYSTSWCGACKAARAWFAKVGIPYLEKNIEHDAVARRNMLGVNPRGGVPTFVIKGQVMVGFSPQAIQRALGR